MTFNPLGNFKPDALLNGGVVGAACAFAQELRSRYPCPLGSMQRIYRHWSVGHLAEDFPDYNGSLAFSGGHFRYVVTHNPQDNAIGVNQNEPASHTYHRNTGAFGIATDDMVFATTHDFGDEGVTLMAVEFLCAGVSAVAAAYNIDLAAPVAHGPFSGEPAVLTHAEAADRPGSPAQYAPYGPGSTCERWDFATLVPLPEGISLSSEMANMTGAALRTREHAYKVEIVRRLAGA